MTPLERAARELCMRDHVDPDSSLGGDGQNFLWMEYAELKVKPVLRAMRIPSAEMLGAGRNATMREDGRGVDFHDIHSAFVAMIDAAMEEK